MRLNFTPEEEDLRSFNRALKLHATKSINQIREAENILFKLASRNPQYEAATSFLKEETIAHAFHNDRCFQSLFDLIVRVMAPEYIFETGTFMGWTTEFLTSNYPSVDIKTAELNSDFLPVAGARLSKYGNIALHHESAELFLQKYLSYRDISGTCLFFLDAHWDHYWPLPDEIAIISKSQIPSVIIVDDFKVSGNPDFGYDEYGDQKICDFSSIVSVSPIVIDPLFGNAPILVETIDSFPSPSRGRSGEARSPTTGASCARSAAESSAPPRATSTYESSLFMTTSIPGSRGCRLTR